MEAPACSPTPRSPPRLFLSPNHRLSRADGVHQAKDRLTYRTGPSGTPATCARLSGQTGNFADASEPLLAGSWSHATQRSHRRERRAPARILIVDDHEIFRVALSALLHTEGIDIADVQTRHAVITAIAFRTDVAIVDLTPANPIGFRIAAQLEALPDAPTILLTSSADRRRFGPYLAHYRFLAKADLCARAITRLAALAAPDSAGICRPAAIAGTCDSMLSDDPTDGAWIFSQQGSLD